MIHVREACGADAPAIRDIFLACYGEDYPYSHYYEIHSLVRMIHSDDTLILVAEDTDTGEVVGTASVITEVGGYSDLVGEFGRLAVKLEARHCGVGKLLLDARLTRVRDRLHVGLIEARVSHPYSLKIAEAQDFSVVGFLPLKMLVRERESLAVLVRYFANALELRHNHPRIIPEVYPLAHLALANCGLAPDAIVDEESSAYPAGHGFQVQTLSTEGYASLLRIERGRVRRREIFGPLRLHYGFFKLTARRSTYLLAREHGQVVGAVGFIHDPHEKTARVFELISVHDPAARFLLAEFVRRCREEWDVCYVEADVSAYAPRMQRTLLELGFVPVAYVPAMVFHEVERLDVVRMVCLLAPPDVDRSHLSLRARAMADLVLRGFTSRQVLPRVALAAREADLFAGLNDEQINRLAGACRLRVFEPGAEIFAEGEADDTLYLLLDGKASIRVAGSPVEVGAVQAGECLGEMSLLTRSAHSATATARTRVEAAVLGHPDLAELARFRPDIGLLMYKNLAVGLGKKLHRTDLARA